MFVVVGSDDDDKPERLRKRSTQQEEKAIQVGFKLAESSPVIAFFVGIEAGSFGPSHAVEYGESPDVDQAAFELGFGVEPIGVAGAASPPVFEAESSDVLGHMTASHNVHNIFAVGQSIFPCKDVIPEFGPGMKEGVEIIGSEAACNFEGSGADQGVHGFNTRHGIA